MADYEDATPVTLADDRGFGDEARLLICFSHLRWNFVFQRPQHLMTRFATDRSVIFWEEPVTGPARSAPLLETSLCAQSGVRVATPHLPPGMSAAQQRAALRMLLDTRVAKEPGPIARWYYTPMMLPFSRHLESAFTVFDCMDELTAFKSAPEGMAALENELFEAADLVFTGGYSLYEAKRARHANIHPYPSSIDVAHFAQARARSRRIPEQAPVLGFFGVIDERMDLALIATLADARPDWRLHMVGPLAKIASEALPRRANIDWAGPSSYDDLPGHLASWDVALMPFANNEATRFISPTKTPEYLAGGRPVVSTPVADVVRDYGALAGVHIASGAAGFIAACDAALAQARSGDGWLAEVDTLLAAQSWDQTFADMRARISALPARKQMVQPISSAPGWSHQPRYDYLIVGAGFAGAVMAERLADAGKRVLIIDRRRHIGGNAYDRFDAAGILIHQYGPHIFHTNSADIVEYLSRFTAWRPYEHRVLAAVDGYLVPIPINRTTINTLYALDLATDEAAQKWLDRRAEPVAIVKTSADVVISKVGRELYEKFFRGYTRKQWGLDPSELDQSVTARVPTRTSTDDRYFTDSFQAMPAAGYTKMFEAMLDHPGIDILLNADFADIRNRCDFRKLIFTGPIDEYFGFRFGALPYRSLRFDHQTHDCAQFQRVATVNYPDPATPFTRITEYKHLTGQVHPRTSITYEYPSDEGDPYYPIPRDENRQLFKRYEALADRERDVVFVGRLATYRYYNMDQVVGQALATFRRLVAESEDGVAVEDRQPGVFSAA